MSENKKDPKTTFETPPTPEEIYRYYVEHFGGEYKRPINQYRPIIRFTR